MNINKKNTLLKSNDTLIKIEYNIRKRHMNLIIYKI